MKRIRTLLAALILQAPALSFANQIVLTFAGNFEVRSNQQVGGQPVETEVNIPFTSTLSIFANNAQFHEDPDLNIAETLFRGSSFSTQVTHAVLDAHPLSIAPSISYSHSVYGSGGQSAGGWNDLSLVAESEVSDVARSESWMYMLMIRGDISLPQGDDQEGHQVEGHDPMSGQVLFEALNSAMNTGRSFDVTEFYAAYSDADNGAMTDYDWYTTGSARLTSVSSLSSVPSVSAVPEPSTCALVLCGLAVSGFVMRRRMGVEV